MSFHQELSHAEFGEPFDAFGDILLYARGAGTVFARPFAQALPQIVAVPESAVENLCQTCIPLRNFLCAVAAVADSLEGFRIAFDGSGDILRTAGAPFDFEYTHAGVDHAVEEVDGLEVFGRHDVFVVDLELIACLKVGYLIAPATYLRACAAVGAGVHLVKAEVAFAAHRHAQCAVAEHLNADRLAFGTGDVFGVYGVVDVAHLLKIQFAGEHDNVGELCVEAHSLRIGYVALRGYVNFDSMTAAAAYRRDVGSDYGRDARFGGGRNDGVDASEVVVVDNSVDCQVSAHAVFVASPYNFAQVVEGEVSA